MFKLLNKNYLLIVLIIAFLSNVVFSSDYNEIIKTRTTTPYY